jgi:hypothetical protein
MQTVALLAAITSLIAAVGTLLLFTVLTLRGKRVSPATDALPARRSDVLSDARSCLQVALRIIARALPTDTSDDPSRPARQLVNLLQAEPELAFAEVVDDRVFSGIESTTPATTVWIVTTDEKIEFDYPEAGVSFSNVVLGNLRRGVDYRYMVVDTPSARVRAAKLANFVEEIGLDDKLRIRFLPMSSGLEQAASCDELVVFEVQDRPELYYLLPGSGRPGVSQRWIKASDRRAGERITNLRTIWELDAMEADRK